MELKLCTKCNIKLPLDSFGKDNHKKTGLCSVCKDCRGKQKRQKKSGVLNKNSSLSAHKKTGLCSVCKDCRGKQKTIKQIFQIKLFGYSLTLKK